MPWPDRTIFPTTEEAGTYPGPVPDTRSVVVVGSGAAGLAAALAASGAGADVLVVERPRPSAAPRRCPAVWCGCRPTAGWGAAARLRQPRPRQPRQGALAYLGAAAAQGDVDLGLVAGFRRPTPDAWPTRSSCARPSSGRCSSTGPTTGASSPAPGAVAVAVAPVATPGHEVERRVQAAFDQPSPTTRRPRCRPGQRRGGPARPRPGPGPGGRSAQPRSLDAGVEIRTGARATELVVEGGDGRRGGGRRAPRTGPRGAGLGRLPTRRRTGGRAAWRGHPSPPWGRAGVRGDGLRMAMAVDAQCWATRPRGGGCRPCTCRARRSTAWPTTGPSTASAPNPGRSWWTAAGRRFVDEAQNYGDVGRAMRAAAGGLATPCWLVFDAAYRRRYPVGPLEPATPDPAWLTPPATSTRLATMLGVDTPTFADSVARFNAGAARGQDPDFGRGSFPYDRWIGDPSAAHPTLAPLCEAPFYALAVHLGCMGTKGGPRTDDRGRVLSSRRGAVGRALCGRQRRGQPVRHRHGGGGCHARAGPRLRLPRRRSGGGGPMSSGNRRRRRAPPRGAPHAGAARPRHPARPRRPAGGR